MSYTSPQTPAPAPYYYPQAPARPGTSGLAIASLVLGIVWVFWIGSILAVIFGHVALRQTRRDGSAGRGMAIAGLVLGYIGLASFTFWIVIFIVAAVQSAGAGG